MPKARVLAFAVAGCLACAAVWAQEPGDLLRQCRQACAGLPPDGWNRITLKREQRLWRVSEAKVHCMGGGPKDVSLRSLAHLTTLEALSVTGTWGEHSARITAEDTNRLSALKQLRRLALYRMLHGVEIRAVTLPKDLEELDLSTADQREPQKEFVSLKDLTKLRRLSLAGRRLADEYMAQIAPLTNLEELDLQGAEITDKGLAELKHLNRLRKLNLNGCSITDAGLAQLKEMKNLEELELAGVDGITAAGLKELQELKSLRSLEIGTIGPTQVAVLKGFPALEKLSIWGREDEGRQLDLSALTKLREFKTSMAGHDEQAGGYRLPENLEEFEGALLEMGGRSSQPTLKSLRSAYVCLPAMERERRGAEGLALLLSLPELRELTFDLHNDATVKVISGSRTLRGLTFIGHCGGLHDAGMKDLGAMRQLESLEIGIGWGKAISNAGLMSLKDLTNLRRLVFDGWCQEDITPDGLACLGEMKQLRSVKFTLRDKTSGAPVDGYLARMKGLSELEELTVSVEGGNLTDEGLKNLAGLKKLRRLDLGDTEGYTDDALASLMKALPDLDVVVRSWPASRN